jgi:putative transposase
MGQSLSNVIVHIIFSTKHRQKLILPEFREPLFGYLGQTLNNLKCNTIIVGGYLDHVHCLCRMSKTITQAKLMEELKSSSSKFMKTLDQRLQNFYWQDGYAMFSVDPKSVNGVIHYISTQEDHHSNNDFQSEFRNLMKEHNLEIDERFVWE